MAPFAVTGSSTVPLSLIIRFANSTPDLLIPIPSPSSTNAASLRTLIRPHLPPTLSTCSLRLIYAGALLPATKPLSTSLRLTPQTPPNRDAALSSSPPQQFYIHCSIAVDKFLTPAELEAEARAGNLHASSEKAPTIDSDNYDTGEEPEDQDDNDDPTEGRASDGAANGGNSDRRRRRTRRQAGTISETPTSPLLPPTPPQGFDRLLSAGLTPAEVASLRSRFLAIQSHTHTPDTMPTASELRALEERWLDNSSGGGGGGGADALGGDGGGPGGFTDDTDAGALEDMLWGNVMGFFWAIGAVVWLVREEGVWSKRRQIGVVTGVLVNLAFCFLRVGG